MGRFVRAISFVSAWAMAGCALQPEGTGEAEVGSDEDAITLRDAVATGELVIDPGDPSPPTPAATLVLYSEAGFWGDTLIRNATPTSTHEAVSLVLASQLQSANLKARVSSFRLICGTRDAYVVLFRELNDATSLHGWSEFGTGRTFGCKANTTLTVNLHQDAPELADNVGSVYLVSHAARAVQAGFSAFIESNWNAATSDLPDGARADGPVRLKLDGSSSFRLRQFLRIDAWQCGERGAIFGLRATMNQRDRTFQVDVVEVYVDTGWGDSWGCRSAMTDEVRSGALDAAARLETSLHSLSALVGEHPRYYFIPGPRLREFDLMGGGERFVPPVIRYPLEPLTVAP